jgi:short-subunit dehydrogenase
MSSLAGRIAIPLMSAYCGTKFAVEAISDALRMELLPFGIRVVAVEPGPVGHTSFSENLAKVSGPYWDRPSKYARAYEAVRQGRSGIGSGAIPAEKVARVVRSAAEAKRPRARYATQPAQALLISLSKAFPRRLIDRAIMQYAGMEANGGKP